MSQQLAGTTTKLGRVESLTELLAAALLTGAKLGLYKSSFTPNPESVEADFEAAEADYTGYAEVALTWSAVGYRGDAEAFAVSNRAFFQATDDVAPNTIGGAWLKSRIDAGPPAVDIPAVYYPFPVPVQMIQALDTISGEVIATSPNLAGYFDMD